MVVDWLGHCTVSSPQRGAGSAVDVVSRKQICVKLLRFASCDYCSPDLALLTNVVLNKH